jgi:phosphoadenosine phosphosulfate reductase
VTAALISPMPVYEPLHSLAEHREALARRAAWRLEDASPEAIVRWAVRTFGRRFAVTSSMADAVLVDVVARVAPGTDVLFLDTGYHFDETLVMRDAVAAVYRGRVNLVTVEPDRTVAEQDADQGPDLFARNPDRCCFLRKVLPLDRALAGYDAWASGLRRDDSLARSRTPVVDWDRRNGMVKVNPLARWTQADVDAYVARNGVLVNALRADGFASIGCFPCTRRPTGEARSGRWTGTGKTECGIHEGTARERPPHTRPPGASVSPGESR